ncbi:MULTISPECIES: hypothetical protein [Bradyrhizobium]|jgi:hypothetical protein|uniref:Uncharacterized protein n=1 Tax=Bradyrhizobium elkanii TaxID=29448 RepID=A0ABV4EPY9_BRAEL|nr:MULTISPECIES: hypothetical protein [Bradyrhizobium]MCP1758821.1 hypothetical protein [Bradyrhizobium elkanii]MCP1975838.1 hypothetical protein [Bradyrhizobium elkanii]MCP1985017.1 hypothetical protein [Bradyrhizobium elkanii]MCS3695232.1 hypothetical protein [Bradyrhizobium elkanii]MCS3890628.1 hypothetical protein [Bradyrhizobium elkanii]
MQISIVTVIDIETALAEGCLDGNAYVIDNTGPFAQSPHARVTNVPGVYDADGSQAMEAVLNWITVGVAQLPPTLPRSYPHRFNIANTARRLLSPSVRTQEHISKIQENISKMLTDPPKPLQVRDRGAVRTYDAPVLNAAGKVLKPDDTITAASVPPVVVRIRGAAVENGVLYPALYGSPDPLTDGWYWSATVDTAKVGRHDYTMEVALYRPVQENSKMLWEPRLFTLSCSIQVSNVPSVNGFTSGFVPGLLPIPPSGPTCVEGDAI